MPDFASHIDRVRTEPLLELDGLAPFNSLHKVFRPAVLEEVSGEDNHVVVPRENPLCVRNRGALIER